jgi:hypothetical protein
MTTTAIREKLYHYIKEADDKQVKAIYSLLEDQMAPAYDWAQDKEFVAELDERVRRYDAGIDPGFSVEETRVALQQMKQDYLAGSKK